MASIANGVPAKAFLLNSLELLTTVSKILNYDLMSLYFDDQNPSEKYIILIETNSWNDYSHIFFIDADFAIGDKYDFFSPD